jgi:hypothetical protein
MLLVYKNCPAHTERRAAQPSDDSASWIVL